MSCKGGKWYMKKINGRDERFHGVDTCQLHVNKRRFVRFCENGSDNEEVKKQLPTEFSTSAGVFCYFRNLQYIYICVCVCVCSKFS